MESSFSSSSASVPCANRNGKNLKLDLDLSSFNLQRFYSDGGTSTRFNSFASRGDPRPYVQSTSKLNIAALSNYISMLKSKRRLLPKNSKKLIGRTLLFVAILQYLSFSSTSSPLKFHRSPLQRFRRLSITGDITPYITTTEQDHSKGDQMQQLLRSIDSPRIPGRRNPPTHIILCKEFLRRKKMHNEGQPIPEQFFHVEEDDAVCRDWSTPHGSIMEMVSNNIISQVSSKYKVTYAHNCQRDAAPDPDGTTDGHEWTTIQEAFPPSGLVLDNGVVDEDQIAKQCGSCISEFNEQVKSHEELQDTDPDDPNPFWFKPDETRHCILYPRTSRPLVNAQFEMDMVAVTELRAEAQSAPFSRVLETIKDRLRLAAVEHKLEHGDPPIGEDMEVDDLDIEMNMGSSMTFNMGNGEGSARFSGFSRRSLLSILGFGGAQDNPRSRFLAEVQDNSNIEEQNGAVIYIDEGSLPLGNATYAKYIPTTVSTIDILVSPLCVDSTLFDGHTEIPCMQHADEIQAYFTNMYPDATIGQHVVASTSAAFSRMILSKYLVCPPGTTGCLMPALAKEDGSFAAVAESPARENTFKYFDFVDDRENHLQVATVPNLEGIPASWARTFKTDSAVSSISANDANDDRGDSNGSETPEVMPTSVENDQQASDASEEEARRGGGGGLGEQSFLSTGDHRDGCVELRGKFGSWELDYAYKDLKKEEAAAHLRGQSNVDTPEARFEDVGADPEADSVEGRFGSWRDSNPECDLDMLNLKGLCEVVSAMGLGVIQFVGDQYTEEQVKSFWSLLGLEDREDPDDIGQMPLEDGQNLHQYRKTAHCTDFEPPFAFDIVFTPNEYLVQNVEVPVYVENTPETRYITVPSNTTHQTITNNYFYDNSQTSTTHSNTESRYNTNTDTNTNTENFSRTSDTGANWYNQPYGDYGGWGGYSGYGGYGGYGGWGYGRSGGVPAMPAYNSQCCCVPFQQMYQHYGGGMPMPGMGGGGGGGGWMPGMGGGGGGGGWMPGMGGGGGGGGGMPPPTGAMQDPAEVQAKSRQVVVAGQTPNTSYTNYVNGVDEFAKGITDYGNGDDVVILRTGVDGQLVDPGRRRAKEASSMSVEELNRANKYMIKAVDEFRRRTKQMDLVGMDPGRSGLPSMHVLDVSRMTSTHPHADKIHHGRRNEQVAPLYDSWNHLLYSNLRDIAFAEQRRKTDQVRKMVDSAPEGSPYHNGVEAFPDPL